MAAYDDMSESAIRIRELEGEVAELRQCLERGVTVASQEHIQNLVERRMLNRERDTLVEQLQRTKAELGSDVWLAFSEAKRLANVNMELVDTLEQRDEEIARLKEQLKALSTAHTSALEKLEELSEERIQLINVNANQKLQISTLRQSVANAHVKQWRDDAAKEQRQSLPPRAQSVEPPKTEALGIPWPSPDAGGGGRLSTRGSSAVDAVATPPPRHPSAALAMSKAKPLPSLLSSHTKKQTCADDYKFNDPRVPVEPTLHRKKKGRAGGPA